MTWNFRLVKHTEPKSGSAWYGVHEVFYNDAGKPWTMTQDPIRVEGESTKELFKDFRLIKRDLKRLPVLDSNTIKWARPPKGIRGGRTKKFKNVKDLMNDVHARIPLRRR